MASQPLPSPLNTQVTGDIGNLRAPASLLELFLSSAKVTGNIGSMMTLTGRLSLVLGRTKGTGSSGGPGHSTVRADDRDRALAQGG